MSLKQTAYLLETVLILIKRTGYINVNVKVVSPARVTYVNVKCHLEYLLVPLKSSTYWHNLEESRRQSDFSSIFY